ncbi:seleno protein domain-containing protein [Dissophora ornata]|nr:seleno protein domain-containing protein [Dissophora ornata]
MPIEIRHPRVEIEFCTGCKWHLRAGWMAQELLLTFGNAIGELALIPGKSATFIVRVNGGICCDSHVSLTHRISLSFLVVVFDRKDHGRFPEMKEVKQLVRGVIAPEMGLGHSDSAVKSAVATQEKDVTEQEPVSAAAVSTAEATAAEATSETSVASSASQPGQKSSTGSSNAVDADDEDSTAHAFDCKTCA